MTIERPLLEKDAVCRPAIPSKLESIHLMLEQFWNDMEPSRASSIPNRWKLELSTAVAEISSNIFRHAFAGLPEPGLMELHLKLYQDRVEAEITDTGVPYTEEVGAAAPKVDDAADLPEGGRGLRVARAVLDELRYWRSKESTNHWLLVKRLPAIKVTEQAR